MADRLRDLIDLVLGSLDDPAADGRALARRAHFSRDHLDRLLAAATGESPVALRRRLLLERAAWQLRTGAATASEAAPAAGYGSLAAFSRAFARAYGVPPREFAADGARPLDLPAPNGIHFHPPAGLLIPGARNGGGGRSGGGGRDGGGGGRSGARVDGAAADAAARALPRRDVLDRLLAHHVDRTRELLRAAARLPQEALARPLRPGFVAVHFEGEEPSAALMAERLVHTLEVWNAAIAGSEGPEPAAVPAPASALLERFERAAAVFARIVRALRDRDAWDDAFVDALCEPPQSFTYGGVVAHVLSFGAVRREMLASVLAELGADGLASGDPIEWEVGR